MCGMPGVHPHGHGKLWNVVGSVLLSLMTTCGRRWRCERARDESHGAHRAAERRVVGADGHVCAVASMRRHGLESRSFGVRRQLVAMDCAPVSYFSSMQKQSNVRVCMRSWRLSCRIRIQRIGSPAREDRSTNQLAGVQGLALL